MTPQKILGVQAARSLKCLHDEAHAKAFESFIVVEVPADTLESICAGQITETPAGLSEHTVIMTEALWEAALAFTTPAPRVDAGAGVGGGDG